MYSHLNVGVLALQGDYERHLCHLNALEVNTREIRNAGDINGLDGLIIPGGESTTMSKLVDRFDMRDKLTDFCRRKGVWGTCAGLILLAGEVDDERINPLSAIDISVIRNGYGRQIHSFFTEINVSLNGTSAVLNTSFIRAPLVKNHGPSVNVLARYNDSPVLLSNRNCLVSSFHTELDEDLTLTKFFLDRFVSVG